MTTAHNPCTCDSIAFARVGDTILCCRCKRPVSLRPASDRLRQRDRMKRSHGRNAASDDWPSLGRI